ncbi:hypothetical protein CRUP_034771 [Coryphaenoides rupestris]|nr:hypothetical protein CRUP_034771 [Coryphaenoides rupestris]
MEPSDSVTHKNGRQRKTAAVNLQFDSIKDREMGGSGPEAEEEAEGLLQGSDSEDRRRSKVRPGLRKELWNILLLLFLYVLQGIPLGLAGSIPLIMQSKSVSYKDQAFFSFVFWPFSLKLLWAPLVDALYFSRFGRRKSWLIPTQYLLGLFMICISFTVDSLLQTDGSHGPNVVTLTAVFFVLAFLAATQDIAVDGWALTMLSRENVGYASTCNSVGQTAGYFLGNVLFLALESANFCNKYLRSEPKDTGLVTLADFLFYGGVVFFISTTLVAIFKRESERSHGKRTVPKETQGVLETYKLLFSIIKLPTVLSFCTLLLTAKVPPPDAVTGLKLVEAGVPKEQLALLAVPMVPLQILLPLIISKYTAGPRPLDVFYKAFPFRLLIGLGYALLVWWTPSLKQDGGFPVYYYAIVLLSYALHQVTLYSMYVACMAFHAKVSDPLIGGTYMTLLNTVTNLGGNWPSTVALWLVDPLTSKECQGPAGQSCDSLDEATLCVKEGGVCVATLDGYYVESVVCVVIGLAWWLWLGKKMKRLQEESPAAWRCKVNQ